MFGKLEIDGSRWGRLTFASNLLATLAMPKAQFCDCFTFKLHWLCVDQPALFHHFLHLQRTRHKGLKEVNILEQQQKDGIQPKVRSMKESLRPLVNFCRKAELNITSSASLFLYILFELLFCREPVSRLS